MKGIVIRNPWAWCITQAWRDPDAKTVENRGWTHPHRGDTAIITGRAVDRDALTHPLVAATIERWFGGALWAWAGVMPWEQGLGAVTAVVDMWDVCDTLTAGGWDLGVRCGCQPGWAMPDLYHHRYRNVRPLAEPVPVRGWQGVRDLPADVETAVRAQIGGTP